MVNWKLLLERIKIKLGLIKHNPDYAIVITIHVTKKGDARVSYDIKADPHDVLKVMDYAKRQIEQEIEGKYGKIIRTKNKHAGVGEMVDGVLEKVTITKEEELE